VRDLLHPLGLNWRAELLLHMASEIMRKHNGKIPFEKEKLESLPGVGRYISSAVRCFAFGYSETLLDTNTVRILGRVYGIAINDSSRRSKSFEKLYESLIDVRHPENFNYAMIDLGAVICKPKNPSCHICPLNTVCAFAHQRL
jgi:A/G-specific adenine glycosylase